LLRDEDNNIFLDVNPDCFKIILNYLASCMTSPDVLPPPLPEVCQALKLTFERLCAFFELFPQLNHSIESDELITDEDSDEDENEDDVLDVEVNISEHFTLLKTLFTEEEKGLRLCKDSILYCQFNDTAWCQGSRESGSGVAGVVVEQPPYAFGKLIDQLRLMAITPPDMDMPRPCIASHEKCNFHAIVNYYFPGMENFILSPLIVLPTTVPLLEVVMVTMC
jgi:hypothetical protein